MTVMTIICWSLFGFIVMSINPFITNWIGFSLFYLTLFLSLVGTAAIAGFVVRFKMLKKEMAFRSVKEAFRQSFLFAILVVVSFVLLSQDLFTWLNIVFLIIALTVLEFFWLSYEK